MPEVAAVPGSPNHHGLAEVGSGNATRVEDTNTGIGRWSVVGQSLQRHVHLRQIQDGESPVLGYPTGVLPAVDLDGRHAAVLWKDIRVDQLLHNREVFVSGRPSLPVSEVFVNHGNHQNHQHPLAMMLCANFLPMTVSEGLSAEEALWMHHNVWKVTLEAGTRWWLDP